ncbi:MAG TPA: hypothetical protein VFI31_18770 [Pirellulales bacterium]|nr:hypothetical protein [Pirellulales bacterium]
MNFSEGNPRIRGSIDRFAFVVVYYPTSIAAWLIELGECLDASGSLEFNQRPHFLTSRIECLTKLRTVVLFVKLDQVCHGLFFCEVIGDTHARPCPPVSQGSARRSPSLALPVDHSNPSWRAAQVMRR